MTTRLSIWIIPLALQWLPLMAIAQPKASLRFDHFSLDEGYYDGIATCVYQDKYHYLWVGTADGLYRYDGYHFQEFRKNTDQPGALKSNVITAITEDEVGHLWIGTEGGGLAMFERKKDKFRHFLHDPGDDRSISSDFVNALVVDKNGNLWIGTDDKGLDLLQYDPQANDFYFRHFEYSDPHSVSLPHNTINTLMVDRKRNIWIGTDKGLARLRYDEPDSLSFSIFRHDPFNDNAITNDMVRKVYEDEKGYIWIGTNRGLNRLEPTSGIIRTYKHDPGDPQSISNDLVRSIEWAADGKIWVGTNNGLNLLDPLTGEFERYYHDDKNSGSISSNIVWCIYRDKQENIWVGTWGGALNRVSPLSGEFIYFSHLPGEQNALSHPFVRGVADDNFGRVWVATAKGLDVVDKNSGKYRHFLADPSNPSTMVFDSIMRLHAGRAENIWLANVRGAYKLNPDGEIIRAFEYDPGDAQSISKGEVWDIIEDKYGFIWMAVYGGGVNCWDPRTGEMTHYRHNPFNRNSLSDDRVMKIYEDRQGNIWAGTYEGGVSRFSRDQNGKVLKIEQFLEEDGQLPSNVVWSILEDADGNGIWLGTANGLCLLQPQTGKYRSYKEEDGLSNNFIFGLLPGVEGSIWMSTNRGLSLFDIKRETFQNFDIRDGIHQNEFNHSAFWESKDGRHLYFGGVNGLIMLDKEGIGKNDFVPRIALNRMMIFNSRSEGMESREEPGINFKDEIVLPYYENTMEFEFAALNFNNPEKNQYAYRLKGLSNQWISLGTSNTIRFGGLDPGRYTLEIKGSNNDGLWNDSPATLVIIITTPWWSSWPAKVSYFLLILLALLGFYQFLLSKRLAEKESERLREQDAFKTKLYTDITHEFRTPLTVISGMTEMIEGNEKAKRLIRRNTENLLSLVNQMLELRKLESGTYDFRMVHADIVGFTRYILEPFYNYAQQKNLSLQMQSEEKEIWMDFDPEVMQSIIANLVSNAIKYNKKGGAVYVLLDLKETTKECFLHLEVKDTGVGMEEAQLKKIFQRFYQVNKNDRSSESGTGVGLALVKEYVEALNGKIKADSIPDHGSSFKVVLPALNRVERKSVNVESLSEAPIFNTDAEIEQQLPQASIDPDQPRILIVEDHPDVLQYLQSSLNGIYNIFIERDGADGLKRALEEVPDLVISDVMMPKMNGFELAGRLKEDMRTSHVPIILLTAKADNASLIEGLKTGVDAYLTKPFDHQELLVRIENLLALRKKLQQRYSSTEEPEPTSDPKMEKEDAFIEKVQKAIQEHLNEPDFGVQELCKQLGLSRTQLHNKMKAVTDRSTSLYIRFIRLKKAKELLERSDKSISEIAFEVGFKDPSYFSRAFNQEFGAAPRQFRK